MSQRIYACGKVTPKNDNTEKFFKFIIQGFIKKKEVSSNEDYESFCIKLYEVVRKQLDLPNKIISFGFNKDIIDPCIILFDKEPDNKCYHTYFDNELMKPYIMVD